MELPRRGDFSFISDDTTRDALQSAFTVCERTPGAWNLLLPEPPSGGFAFDNRPQLSSLKNEIDSAYRPGHSGGTMAFTLRNMQGIARLGWDQWVQTSINQQAAAAESIASRRQELTYRIQNPLIGNNARRDEINYIDSPKVTTPFDRDPGVCSICYDPFNNTTVAVNDGNNNGNPTTCGHMYHRACLERWINNHMRTCPMCRGNISSYSPVVTIPPSPTETPNEQSNNPPNPPPNPPSPDRSRCMNGICNIMGGRFKRRFLSIRKKNKRLRNKTFRIKKAKKRSNKRKK